MNQRSKALTLTRTLFNTYDINIKFTGIKFINLLQFNSQLMTLKLKGLVSNTEYEALREIKGIIDEIQNFDALKDYQLLVEKIEKLIEYKETKAESRDSNFVDMIQFLSATSKESIVNTEEFNNFNRYMHVERNIQNVLEAELEAMKYKDKALVFLVGSVGDGKSHLISYLNSVRSDLFEGVEIYNDATESDNPHKTAVETLINKLGGYFSGKYKKMIIAINIGMLHNLLTYLVNNDLLSDLIHIIEDSKIFSSEGMEDIIYRSEDVRFISFLKEEIYTVKDGNIESEFYNNILSKVFAQSEENPFYAAFVKDDGDKREEPIYINYRLLLNPRVQATIRFLLIKIQIENKRILTTRSVLNFLYDIIVPETNAKNNDSYLPTLLFENHERSQVLKSIAEQDPLLTQSTLLDQLNIDLYNAIDFEKQCKDILGESFYSEVEPIILLIKGLDKHKRKFEMIIRLHFLYDFSNYGTEHYLSFIRLYDAIDKSNKAKKEVYSKLLKALYAWNGSPQDNYIYSDSIKPNSKLLLGLNIKPKILSIESSRNMTIDVKMDINDNIYQLNIDYNLFNLLEKIDEGYILKETDKEGAVMFSKFIEDILNEIKSLDSTIIHLTRSNASYIIKDVNFGYEIGSVKS
ncbi:DNA phosphorothioation-dependent restriction protein DptF [Macrococcoides caseolyticum]|uniref:DNA phosphorothioation-dependent restriction protein DptF n=1 Tax=Macrococcoides caseolyticum TaxID=69966 RepID=UPI000DFF5A1F|nr:DNA phosphorothioation-dependent restriction protein DptF [Macrococcus caseolyticus]STY78252.1 DNA phosphorothioation-dependent restriction protein DptF [Macrococcus caseolyticus]